ncbi:hypothetical protein [Leptospira jelokensis]|uniref:hypothetical protein n=1 Tax=Leptospira jelokensis TaxID=2484931 RepID=UPI001090D2EA|nr:hypothetical protein [Leptospira jelokensis]TGL97941.1 hypothetical protein EHQ79_19025 [Leptospira jelokensis]
MFEMITSFFGTWKNQIIGIMTVVLLILAYLAFRTLNKKIGESQNEIIPIEQTNTPDPSMFDDICLYLTNKQCP